MGRNRRDRNRGWSRLRIGGIGLALVVLLWGGAAFVHASLKSNGVGTPKAALSPLPAGGVPAASPKPAREGLAPALEERPKGMPSSPGVSPGNLAGASAWYMQDGSLPRRVAAPEDPWYEDHRRMMTHWRSIMAIRGDDVPYDPEWRAAAMGRREAQVHDLPLQGGATSLSELAKFLLMSLQEGSPRALLDFRVNREEYEMILWPEFPESRPFLNIGGDEGWMFLTANSTSGINEALSQHGGKSLEPAGLRFREITEFTNFKLYRDVVLTARDTNTGEVLELDFVKTVVERKDRFKVYLFKES